MFHVEQTEIVDDRQPRAVKTYTIDLTVPVDRKVFQVELSDEKSCFGKKWDLGTKKCSMCADKDVCGIWYREIVDSKAKALEEKNGVKYLDTTDFDNVTTDKLLLFIQNGKTTLAELITEIMRLANTSDNVAAQEWLKRWHKEKGLIRTENKIVWLKK